MGSYDLTCGMTGVTISPGDKVYVYFVKQKIFENTPSYTNGFWTPITLGLPAVYDDYGRFDFSKTPAWHKKMVINHFKECIIDMPQGDNEYHEPAVVGAKIKTLEEIVELINESRVLFKKNPHMAAITDKEVDPHIGLIPVHAFYVDKFCKNEIHTGHYEKPQYFKDVLQHTLTVLDKFPDKMSKKIEDVMLLSLDIERICRSPDYRALGFMFEYGEGRTMHHYRDYITDYFTHNKTPSKKKQAAKFIEAVVTYYFLEISMSVLRKTWNLQSHYGSQTREDEAYVLQNKYVNDFCIGRINEMKTEIGPDDYYSEYKI